MFKNKLKQIRLTSAQQLKMRLLQRLRLQLQLQQSQRYHPLRRRLLKCLRLLKRLSPRPKSTMSLNLLLTFGCAFGKALPCPILKMIW